MKINYVSRISGNQANLAVIVGAGGDAAQATRQLGTEARIRISQAVKAAKFAGKRDQVLEILAPAKSCDRLILIGAGDAQKLKDREWELTGGLLVGTLQNAKLESCAVILALTLDSTRQTDAAAAHIGSGARLRNYRFGNYKSKAKDVTELANLTFQTPDPNRARAEFAKLHALAEGVHFARNLVNEPANVLFPVEFAARAKALTKLGVKVEILDQNQMKKLGMGAFLGVAQGSNFPPRLVVMHWNGGRKGEAPVAFVGKGVTFDTGGVSIKQAAGMEDMKGDMAGAAAVTGLMHALAKRKAKCNVIGAIGLVENAIGGAAQRPGDVVKSMSGQTIAVLNTDAEGRLVLADVCWYVQDRFKPKFMVDLATLTGAIMVALGKEHAGLFSNDDTLSDRLIAAGKETGERVWRMPLAPEYDKVIDSDIADVKNIGNRYGGAITGAQFIQRFVGKTPWAHLDIAGVALDSPKNAISQSWSSGWGVRLLNRLVADHYEN